MPFTTCLAAGSFPQMNIDGGPPFNCGLTINAAPTELNALTESRRAEFALQPLQQGFVERGEELEDAVIGRRICDRVGRVDDDLAREVE